MERRLEEIERKVDELLRRTRYTHISSFGYSWAGGALSGLAVSFAVYYMLTKLDIFLWLTVMLITLAIVLFIVIFIIDKIQIRMKGFKGLRLFDYF
jgi:low affinity Fe/Cu permease